MSLSTGFNCSFSNAPFLKTESALVFGVHDFGSSLCTDSLTLQCRRPSLVNIAAFVVTRHRRIKFAKSPVAYYNNGDATFNQYLVPLCGDVELNPGQSTVVLHVPQMQSDNRDNDGVDHHQNSQHHLHQQQSKLTYTYTRWDLLQFSYNNNTIDRSVAVVINGFGLRRRT